MRIRTIKPEFFVNDELANLGALARLFFIGLWCLADKEGRLEDNPVKIQVQIIPYEHLKGKITAEQLLKELSPKFIVRYEVKGKKYIQILTFLKHQRPHPHEPESQIPKCNDKKLHVITCHDMSYLIREGKGREGKGREGKGKEKERDGCIYSNEFEQFWKAYPRKVEKQQAWMVWQKMKPDLNICLSAVKAQIASGQLNTIEPKFILYPERWIKREKWNDEIIKQGSDKHGTGTIQGKYAGRETVIKGD